MHQYIEQAQKYAEAARGATVDFPTENLSPEHVKALCMVSLTHLAVAVFELAEKAVDKPARR